MLKPENRQFNLKSEDEWKLVVQYLIPFLQPRTLILVDGDLGAGKTTFTKYLTQYFGIEQISSPTYAIMQKYSIKQATKSLVLAEINSFLHVDLYRLESADEINAAGFWDMLNSAEQSNDELVVVEWANRITDEDWPLNWNIVKVRISKKNANDRSVDIKQLFQK